MLVNFDAPNMVVTACRRERSNTPLQALNLLNDPVFVEAAEALAYRTIADSGSADARLNLMFERALGRTPTLGDTARFRKGLDLLRAKYQQDPAEAAKVAPASLPGVE